MTSLEPACRTTAAAARPRLPWWAGPAVAVAAAVAAVVAVGVSAALGAGTPMLLGDGPPWWAAPVLRAVRDVLAALALGLLLLLGGLLGPPPAPDRAGLPAPLDVRVLPAVRLAAGCSAGAALAAAGVVLLGATTAVARPVWRPGPAAELLGVVGGLGGLRVLGYAVVLLMTVALVAARARHRATLVRLAVAAALATALTGVSGHAAGHPAMVGVTAVHVLAASAWAGGLASLLVLRATGGTDVGRLLPRWSHLAGLCFAAVAVSGVAAVALRSQAGLPGTAWLLVALAKLAVLVALAAAGSRQRRDVVTRARAGEPVPWPRLARLGAAELVLMSVAAGGGVALSAA